ncbi:MAG: hypothetical protein LBB63_04075 [Holosporaceae bacterium]|jgi:hypothetical protein|nr:hypothetical protein [Holosporaceae bacterium]
MKKITSSMLVLCVVFGVYGADYDDRSSGKYFLSSDVSARLESKGVITRSYLNSTRFNDLCVLSLWDVFSRCCELSGFPEGKSKLLDVRARVSALPLTSAIDRGDLEVICNTLNGCSQMMLWPTLIQWAVDENLYSKALAYDERRTDGANGGRGHAFDGRNAQRITSSGSGYRPEGGRNGALGRNAQRITSSDSGYRPEGGRNGALGGNAQRITTSGSGYRPEGGRNGALGGRGNLSGYDGYSFKDDHAASRKNDGSRKSSPLLLEDEVGSSTFSRNDRNKPGRSSDETGRNATTTTRPPWKY